MAAPTLAEQAATAATQGQQLLSQDQSEAASAKSNYDNYSGQATQANQQEQSEAAYMQGAGSGQSVYNNELGTLEDSAGYNPSQLADANKSLFSLTGALNSANSSFNTPGGVGMYGVSAPAVASYESSILNPLQTGANTANTEVGALNTELGTFETGAGQATTNQVQSEQNTVTALNNAVVNYQAQATAALQNMQFYSNLAQTQGGLNASEQQSYATAEQALAQASQAIAQSKLLLAQTTGQNITNQADINQLPAGTSISGLTSAAAKSGSSGGSSLSVGSANPQQTLSVGSLQGGGSVLQGAVNGAKLLQ
jgi:hypothetical protein